MDIWAEEFERIIGAPDFAKIAAVIGHGDSLSMAMMLGAVSMGVRDLPGGLERSVYDPERFYFEVDRDGNRILQIDELGWRTIQEDVAEVRTMLQMNAPGYQDKPKVSGGCPFHAVRSKDGGSAFKDFERFVIEVVKRLYVSGFPKKETLESSGEVFCLPG